MDDLAAKLTQILNDPGSIQQIASLAGALAPEQNALSPSGAMDIPEEFMTGLQSAIRKVGENDEKQEALVQALSPYLKPNRRQRLQQAVKIARLSQVAGAALRSRHKEE